ncbi:MAG: hypothetical protein K6E54_09220 [Bacteroidaceae bacterium]|nr:hypothetical protein [Bacteroidaceae bacterium]
MKNYFIKSLFVLTSLVMCFSCTSDNEETAENNDGYTTITFNVSPMRITQESTRATLSETFSMLELALYTVNADGSYTKYKEVDQTSSSSSFGVVTLENIKCGNYRLLALGHKSAAHPDIDDPTDVAFVDFPVVYWYSNIVEVTKSTTALDVTLDQAVARIRFVLTGYIPDEVKKLQLTLEGASNNFDAITGFAKSTTTRVAVLDITDEKRASQTIAANVHFFLTKSVLTTEDSYVNVTIAGLDADGNQVDPKTYNKVPLKIGAVTYFNGSFFNYGSTGMNITVDATWEDYETVHV